MNAQTTSTLQDTPLRILLIGSGAIGSAYGAQFSLAGHHLSVLAHGDRENDIAQRGILLRDMQTGKTETAPASVIADPTTSTFDLVIIAVRAEQLPSTFPTLYSLTDRPDMLFFGNNPEGHHLIPTDLPGSVQLGFPGIGGALVEGVVNYQRVSGQPTTLELVASKTTAQIHAVLKQRGFAVQNTADMNGWLAYHTVFIDSISMALLRADCDTQKLANDRALLTLMCRSMEEGFAAFRKQGVKGLPRNLAILHSPILRPIAILYWQRTMRSPKSELYFAVHIRDSPDETLTLAKWVLTHLAQDPTRTEHLRRLLGPL